MHARNRWWTGPVVAVVLAMALVAAGCSDDDGGSGSADDEEGAAAEAPDFEVDEVVPQGELVEAECAFEPEAGEPAVDADCYELTVPERHEAAGDGGGDSTGATLTLPVAVVHPSGEAAPDPIVAPSGGPGYDDVRDLDGWATVADRYGRDVVVWDQRGTGLADPSLDCPEREEAFIANFEQAGEPADELAAIEASLEACRDRLVAEGIDLEAYDTVQNAFDAVALREALGYDEWDVLGVSYGSRIGLQMVRVDPEGTRAAVLDSVYPPGVGGLTDLADGAERAFAALFAGCEADPACAEAHPDLEQTFTDLVEQYTAEPVEVPVTLDDGTEIDLVLTGTDLYGGLFNAMYDTELIPLLPGIIDSLAEGDTSIVPQIAQRGIPFVNSISEGMYLSVDCRDNASLDDPRLDELVDDPAEGTTLLAASSMTFCDTWDVGAVHASFPEPVSADVPALVLAGTYDPITPPANSEAAADALPTATFVAFDGVGHGASGASECAQQLVLAFLDDPTTEPDTSCAAEVDGPDFS